MSSAHKPAGWLSGLCIVFLLLAGGAQAAHFCGFRAPAADSSQLHLVSDSASLCLVCLMAQTATASPIFLALVPVLIRGRRAPILQARKQSFLKVFYLYVRPPPAF